MGRDGKPFRPFVTAGHHLRHPRKTRSLSAQFQPLRIGDNPRPGIAEREVVPTRSIPAHSSRCGLGQSALRNCGARVVPTRSIPAHSSRCGLGQSAPRNCGARGCPNSQRFRTFQPLRIGDNSRPETAEREVVPTRSVSEHSSRCGLRQSAPRNCGARVVPTRSASETLQLPGFLVQSLP